MNTVGSTIARETDAGIYNHAGPEMGVASTKAFVSQLTALIAFDTFSWQAKRNVGTMGKRIAEELKLLPQKIKTILSHKDVIQKIAHKYSG